MTAGVENADAEVNSVERENAGEEGSTEQEGVSEVPAETTEGASSTTDVMGAPPIPGGTKDHSNDTTELYLESV